MLRKAVPALALVASVSGCSYQPKITDAYFHKFAQNEPLVVVRVANEVAKTIKKKQLYFSMVVLECQGGEKRFPIEPRISGQIATEFKYVLSGQYTDVTGSIPEQILREYNRPCVFLEGGGYLSGKIKSQTAPLVER